MAKKPDVQKNNTVLDQLDITYVPVGQIKPNSYNPNRQSAHDFELLCKSIAEDGFTQPIVVLKSTLEVVDGEHRWRACKHLGYDEVPCVLVNMSPEQMRIATLRHNRARGNEDADLASDVLRALAEMGAIDWAKESLSLDDVEVQRLLTDMGNAEQYNIATPDELLGPSGNGLAQGDQGGAIDLTADRTRARERLLQEAKNREEAQMAVQDSRVYRVMLFYVSEEAAIVKRVLGDNPPAKILAMCRAHKVQGQAAQA